MVFGNAGIMGNWNVVGWPIRKDCKFVWNENFRSVLLSIKRIEQ